MKVLLADDSDLILERLQEMACKHRHVEIVALCDNGTDTLESLRMFKPDLAIVDIQMPGLSGIEVLKEIRKEDKTIKIIILTFFASAYYRQLALQSGADYFFNKADDFDKVSEVIGGMGSEVE